MTINKNTTDIGPAVLKNTRTKKNQKRELPQLLPKNENMDGPADYKSSHFGKTWTKAAPTEMTPPPPPPPPPPPAAPASNRAARRELVLRDRQHAKLQAELGADASPSSAAKVEKALLAWERSRKRLADKRKLKLAARRIDSGIKNRTDKQEKRARRVAGSRKIKTDKA